MRILRARPLSYLFAVLLFSACHSSFAQTFTSSITGTVAIPSGAVVAGAQSGAQQHRH